MRSVIACENCKYYDEIEDADIIIALMGIEKPVRIAGGCG